MPIEDTIEAICDSIYRSHQAGDHFPDAWKGKLTVEEAYRVQLGLLAKRVAGGARQVGWKIGFTAEAPRQMFGADAPVFGYLLEEGRFPNGHTFALDTLGAAMVESEVLVTLASELKGPGCTAAQARAAVKEIAPAFEVITRRGDMRVDLSLGLVDNVMHTALVVGEGRPLTPQEDLGEVRAEAMVNGKLTESVLGKEAMDNPIDSLAWLANTLAPYGRSLEAGQIVLTGTFTKPPAANVGDRFETRFSGLGAVSASFA